MPRIRTSSAAELFVPLRRGDRRPLYRQLEEQLRDSIRTGRLAPRSSVPSTRALAKQLGVSRGIVVETYEQLIAEGYLASRPGGTTRVARAPTTPITRAPEPEPRRFVVDFRPGRPDLDAFPRAAWLRSLRRVLNETPSERLGYLDGRGVVELREALAAYLNRVRGTAADAGSVLICSGFTQGLTLVARVLASSGVRRVAVEDPGYAEARAMIRSAGLSVVGIPVDDLGMDIDRLARANVDAVVVTPAHQYPTGGVLPPERRAALAAWAVRRSAFVVEDDYDAEFRYDREPIGALQGLAPDHVVYAGSASKILLPGLRLGWLVAPVSLAEGIARAKRADDMGSSAFDQLAFGDFVSTGELDRHLRRMRPIYRARRDALLAALGRHLPEFQPVGASAGLHVLAWMPPGLDEAAFIRSALDAGVSLEGIAESRIAPGERGAIVFGYASVVERAANDGLRRLAAFSPAPRQRRDRNADATGAARSRPRSTTPTM